MVDSGGDYKFLELRDVIASINQKVNLIGVVIEYGFPKTTGGSDSFRALKIVDESYQKHGLSIHIFAEHFGALPHVLAPGDIIQLSRVTIKSHGTEVFAVFHKKYSTFALYEGTGGESFHPYQSYPNFHSRDMDKKFITGLRNWFADFQLDADLDEFSMVREVKASKSVNLACKIIHVQEFGDDEWMAFVWDGTDTPPNELSLRLEDEKKNPLPLNLEPSGLSRETLLKFPRLGSVLRVVVFNQGIKKHGLQLLKSNIGKWMKLRNVFCEVHDGLWRGVLTPLTKVLYTPEVDCLVSERERLYDMRLGMTNGRLPYWTFPWRSTLTEVDHKNGTVLTLMDVLTWPEVTAKFVCVVRVLASFPWFPKDFRSSSGIYRVRVTLEDPTARIHAFLYGEDAEQFFDGYPSVEILTSKHNALLGVATSDGVAKAEDTPRNPPWVQCLLKSYFLDESDVWGTRQFRIFGTKMVMC